MMLEQIERKHRKMMEEQQLPPKPTKPKIVGVKVEPDLYQQLLLLKKRRGLTSIKAALLLAAEEGIARL
jgi:hypothetical protein